MRSLDDPLPPSGPWRMDRLALGYHLGAALQDTIRFNLPASQSCRTLYILGDPTLRACVLAPPPYAPSFTVSQGTVSLSWNASPDAVDGYYVYRGTSLEEALSNPPLTETSSSQRQYTDTSPPHGVNLVYAIRAVKLVNTGAGSFNNLSQAVWVTAVWVQ